MFENDRMMDDAAAPTRSERSVAGTRDEARGRDEVAFALAPVNVPNEGAPLYVILGGDGRISSLCRSNDDPDVLDVIGSHFEILFAPDSRHGRLPGALLARARRTGSAAIHGRFLRGDGTVYPARCTLVALRGDEGRSRGFAMALHPLDEAEADGGSAYPLLRDPAPRSLCGRAVVGVVYLVVSALEGLVASLGALRR